MKQKKGRDTNDAASQLVPCTLGWQSSLTGSSALRAITISFAFNENTSDITYESSCRSKFTATETDGDREYTIVDDGFPVLGSVLGGPMTRTDDLVFLGKFVHEVYFDFRILTARSYGTTYLSALHGPRRPHGSKEQAIRAVGPMTIMWKETIHRSLPLPLQGGVEPGGESDEIAHLLVLPEIQPSIFQ